MALNSIEELVEDIRQGKMVILMDDEDRENEGDIIMAAECCQPEHINFMAKHARGLICMPMTRERCETLKLPLMAPRNGSGFGTKFTVSIEAAEGVTTGISAADRARTVQAAAAKDAKAEDIVSPGHIFPLMAQPGGTLARAGHTEAACDLARMAGFEPSGVICEVMNDDGTMSRRAELEVFAAEHGLKIGTIADLIHYRMIHERTVQRVSEQSVESELGEFNLVTYRDAVEGDVHMALTLGKICAEEPTLVRVHNMDHCVTCCWSSSQAAGACARPWPQWPKPAVVWCCCWGTRWTATCCWRTSAKARAMHRPRHRLPTAPWGPVRRSCATSVCARCA